MSELLFVMGKQCDYLQNYRYVGTAVKPHSKISQMARPFVCYLILGISLFVIHFLPPTVFHCFHCERLHGRSYTDKEKSDSRMDQVRKKGKRGNYSRRRRGEGREGGRQEEKDKNAPPNILSFPRGSTNCQPPLLSLPSLPHTAHTSFYFPSFAFALFSAYRSSLFSPSFSFFLYTRITGFTPPSLSLPLLPPPA